MFLTAGGILVLLSLIVGACVIRSTFLIVTVEHQSMLPTLQHGDRLLALSSLSFDMCAYDVFGTLAAGATILRPDQARKRGGSASHESLAAQKSARQRRRPS